MSYPYTPGFPPPPGYGAPPPAFGGSPLSVNQDKTNSWSEGGVQHTQYTVTVRNNSGQPLTGYTLRLSSPAKEVSSMITGPDGVTLSFPSHVSTLRPGETHKWGFTTITPPPHNVTAIPPGFGAPSFPGYGAPAPSPPFGFPPPAPGYGAPVATPPYGFPPAPTPGYGAPVATPPYGFPPAPTPGYGAPPQPSYPPPGFSQSSRLVHGTRVIFRSFVTGKSLRIMPSLEVNGFGGEGPLAKFSVHRSPDGLLRIHNENSHWLRLSKRGGVEGRRGKGGRWTCFRVHDTPDSRGVLLESSQRPGLFIVLAADGCGKVGHYHEALVSGVFEVIPK